MVRVIIFEKSGKILLADLIDEKTRICRKNFANIIPGPDIEYTFIPKHIAKHCMENAPSYLYKNYYGDWESIKGE